MSGRAQAQGVDKHRAEIEKALEKGATQSDVARVLGIPRSTLQHALERWARPDRQDPGAEALEELRRLVG